MFKLCLCLGYVFLAAFCFAKLVCLLYVEAKLVEDVKDITSLFKKSRHQGCHPLASFIGRVG